MAWAREDQGATWQHHPINVREIGYRGADTIVNPANPAQAIDDPKVDAFTFPSSARPGAALRRVHQRHWSRASPSQP